MLGARQHGFVQLEPQTLSRFAVTQALGSKTLGFSFKIWAVRKNSANPSTFPAVQTAYGFTASFNYKWSYPTIVYCLGLQVTPTYTPKPLYKLAYIPTRIRFADLCGGCR